MRWFSAGVLMLLHATGCCTVPPDVIVVDQLGRPVSGAVVTCASLSIGPGGTSVLTSDNGSAALPNLIEAVEWISVEKPGFERRESVAVRGVLRPVCIILQAAAPTTSPNGH